MSTPKQIAANRQNAKKSTGPRTAAGKQAVRVNALRHGLTGRTVVLPADDLDLYKTHVKTLTASLKPEGPEEIQLAALIADDYWRLQRVKSIEDGIFAIQFAKSETLATHPCADAALNQAKAFLQHSKELERLTLYESRILRNIKTATARLEKLQSDRRAARAEALGTAKLAACQAKQNTAPYTPDPHIVGFEFSAAATTPPVPVDRLPDTLAKAA